LRIIILSGGSGKRLWPLSNEIRSKLFLKLLPTEDGQRESMIQRVCGQLEKANLLANATIVTHQSQVEIMQSHIGEQIPILAEPHKRGTFMAIGLTAAYFHSKLRMNVDETICVIPADLFVELEFYHLVKKQPEFLAKSGAKLALIGTKPDHPSIQYGYIVPQVTGEYDYYDVFKFVEKPNEELAARLMEEHALWNCGIFSFRLSFMLSCLTGKGLPIEYEKLLDHYERFPETSFDQEVVEKTSQSIVVPYEKSWRDLGDWRVITNYLGRQVIGQGKMTSDSIHTHLINELKLPIHVIGISNIIVAASPDGILIANKDKSNQIKSFLNERQIPKYTEKRWGKYQLLDHSITDSETLTKKVEMLPRKNTSYHMHEHRKEIIIILSGNGELILDGVHQQIRTGDVLQITQGVKHAIKSTTSLEYLEIQIGNQLMIEDIARLTMTWEEAIHYCTYESTSDQSNE
jgi:mannose-1-phosphate guanylyltransferase